MRVQKGGQLSQSDLEAAIGLRRSQKGKFKAWTNRENRQQQPGFVYYSAKGKRHTKQLLSAGNELEADCRAISQVAEGLVVVRCDRNFLELSPPYDGPWHATVVEEYDMSTLDCPIGLLWTLLYLKEQLEKPEHDLLSRMLED